MNTLSNNVFIHFHFPILLFTRSGSSWQSRCTYHNKCIDCLSILSPLFFRLAKMESNLLLRTVPYTHTHTHTHTHIHETHERRWGICSLTLLSQMPFLFNWKFYSIYLFHGNKNVARLEPTWLNGNGLNQPGHIKSIPFHSIQAAYYYYIIDDGDHHHHHHHHYNWQTMEISWISVSGNCCWSIQLTRERWGRAHVYYIR